MAGRRHRGRAVGVECTARLQLGRHFGRALDCAPRACGVRPGDRRKTLPRRIVRVAASAPDISDVMIILVPAQYDQKYRTAAPWLLPPDAYRDGHTPTSSVC